MKNNSDATQANIHSNMLFVMADVVESLLLDTNELLKQENCELKHESKRQFNIAIKAIKNLKSHISKCSEETQEHFGNDADMFYQFNRMLLDRCGTDDMKMFRFYNYIKQFPSELNMEFKNESQTWGHIK